MNNILISRLVLLSLLFLPFAGCEENEGGNNSTTDPKHQWVESIQFKGHHISKILFHQGHLYAGTYAGGLYKSLDSGKTWSLDDSVSHSQVVFSFAASGNLVYVGTTRGIFRSTDNGLTWNSNPTLLFPTVQALLIQDNKLFAGLFNGGGIYVSTDSTKTWSLSNSGILTYDVSSLALFNTTLYATVIGEGIYMSTNGGTSWNIINDPFVSSIQYESGHDFLFFDNKIYYATHGGLLLSSDNGVTWTKSDSGIVAPWLNDLDRSGSLLFAGGFGVHLSSDSGITWTHVPSDFPNSYVETMATVGSTLWVGTLKGLFYNDSPTSQPANN